jgi:phage terminase Nu1 subunit (DNA packaging protein)
MQNLTTIANWAKSLGISRQQGYAAVKRCEIPVTDGKVDQEFATMLYQRHTRPRANGKRDADAPPPGAGAPAVAPPGTVPSYERSRARREAAEAALAEMKEAEMSGKYLVKAEVDAVLFEVARAMRDGLTNCARRIAADVAGMSLVEECEEVIDREHRSLLASMAQTLGTRLGVGMESEAT